MQGRIAKRNVTPLPAAPEFQPGAGESMPMPGQQRIDVIYSTPRADALSEFVSSHFSMPGPVTCNLLRRGFNDTFEVRARDGLRTVLRLSGRRARGEADVATESAFLSYLDRMGIPVAAPIPSRDGKLYAMAPLPEGPRPAVLFCFVEGRPPELGSPLDAKAHGVTLARIHAAAGTFVNSGPERYKLDLDHLLRRPMSAILEVEGLSDEVRAEFATLAERLASKVESPGLSWTRCHGDCHGGNARMIVEGPRTGQAAFFDFDDGGLGYLAYDLAVFLWARVSFGRRATNMWHSFIEGYRSVHPISVEDFEATNLFVLIRHIWLLGEYASRRHEWGSEAVPAEWISKQLEFLRAWEDDKMSPRLL
jgi:Ser/Thr protein kinase RdoA (MazF antagonist)